MALTTANNNQFALDFIQTLALDLHSLAIFLAGIMTPRRRL
jgi:hypothetical protein